MPLGLFPVGTGGAGTWLLKVGLDSFGTGGRNVSAGAIDDCMSAGVNCTVS